MKAVSCTPSVRRIRWRAGSLLASAALNAELKGLTEVQGIHADQAHGKSDAAARVVGAQVHAVDRSVEMSMPRVDLDRREWAVAMGRKVISLGWGASARTVCRVLGNLTVSGLKASAVRMTAPAPKPGGANPFRLLRLAADPKAKTPETFAIEIASPPDLGALKDGLPPGLRIGTATAAGFVSFL